MTRVAVITRTKNRPLLLRRCAETLLRQDCSALTWILVNDAGDHEAVEDIAAMARARGLTTRLIHREQSDGVWPPANHGLREADAELIHLHDDDDTVEPGFYRRAIEFLDQKPHYVGVVTAVTRVDEELQNNQIVTCRARRLTEPDGAFHLSDMFNGNMFPPIAFVYRRSVHDRIGAYDESLPVLGDWDFNMRLMRHFDIGGINEALANWHFRSSHDSSGTPQTVVAGQNLHREYTALIRNRMLREGLDNGVVSPALLVAQGRNQQLSNNLLRIIDDRTASMLKLRNAVKRLLGVGSR
jgi:glycosyltransferase involved in cell wall biosynthesis